MLAKRERNINEVEIRFNGKRVIKNMEISEAYLTNEKSFLPVHPALDEKQKNK